MAYAASLRDVDCGPSAVRSIATLRRAISERSRSTPHGAWVVGRGYDESALAERRHPTRHDLDAAAPDVPVRLVHRSGHACVLNSAALAQVGIDAQTPDPVEGVIARDAAGEPTGLLLEMDAYLDGRIPRRSAGEFDAAMRLAGERLAALGVTSVVDATPTNSLERWRTFARLKRRGGVAAPNHHDGGLRPPGRVRRRGHGLPPRRRWPEPGPREDNADCDDGRAAPAAGGAWGNGSAGARGGLSGGDTRRGGRVRGGGGAGCRRGARATAHPIRRPHRALLGVSAGRARPGERIGRDGRHAARVRSLSVASGISPTCRPKSSPGCTPCGRCWTPAFQSPPVRTRRWLTPTRWWA